ASAHYQPGLVAVPHGRDRIHRPVASAAHLERGEQDADAEVETVEHDIGEHRKGDDEGPDRGEVEGHGSLPVRCASPGVTPAERIGSRSALSGSGSFGRGGLLIRRSMYQMPTPKTAK